MIVFDKMQQGYEYALSAPMGRDFAPDFTPELTPKEMLALGVFEGRYLNDCRAEFPADWFENAMLSPDAPDVMKNCFKIKSRMSLPDVFEISDTFFRVTFRYNKPFDETSDKTGKKNGEKTTQKILEAIEADPQITRHELAKVTGISESGVKWQLKKLKDEGIIERVGSLKGGKWVVK